MSICHPGVPTLPSLWVDFGLQASVRDVGGKEGLRFRLWLSCVGFTMMRALSPAMAAERGWHTARWPAPSTWCVPRSHIFFQPTLAC